MQVASPANGSQWAVHCDNFVALNSQMYPTMQWYSYSFYSHDLSFPKGKPAGPTAPTVEQLEDIWDEVGGDLSAIVQGRGEIPTDVTPFDAASEVDVDQQR